ncbi:hypothetical protein D3C73_1184600 [compost metagenome]
MPAASTNSKVKLPLVINVKLADPPLFVIVTGSLGVIVATTAWLVGAVTLYATEAIGAVMSIWKTTVCSCSTLPA